ncbi:transcriptional regulator [Massilia dura]|uniref:Transcriptional regulator n=1 Tax=Pseudoduganella dura TaxID=321982 RepID=A0A6I3XT93_9BURK|nr:winged helix-turn-helix domain-containing protein [Pseudoduganella dura]MUI15718.1 transcriptional regulator [Pseudoduganella dura]GGX88881.1 transcriptional regulator [Pseudoduganella dura]
MNHRGFRFGEWHVEVAGNALRMGETRVALEPRAMDVLRYLCRHPHAVVPAEELLEKCWGSTELGDNPVHKAIAQLRKALGDSSTDPRYIETVRKRGYRAIAEVVEEAPRPDAWDGGSPFRGLAAFEESHAAIFFGRVQAATRLRQTVLDQVSGGCAMALVLGASGSGKTSLVRAGLLPQLMVANGGLVAVDCPLHMDCADLGGSGLLGALAAVLLDAERDGAPLFDGVDAVSLGRRLRDEPAAVAAALSPPGPTRLAVFVDRLEAVFRAAAGDAERAAFFHALDRLARANVLVLLACRNDFYPQLMAVPEMMALKTRGGHFDIDPPDGAGIAQMVREPARAARLTFERDAGTGAALDDVLCDAARASPDVLPLLQYCLDELYRQRGDDGLLRFDVFRRLGGIEGALGVRAEQVVAALPAAQQAALPHVLSLLVAVGDEQHAVTARRPAWEALATEPQRELVRALVDARLLVSELSGEVPCFGVAHEALLRRWPRVADWIERHRQDLQVRTRVTAQAERWAAGGKPKDLLLPRGSQVNGGRGLLAAGEVTLTPVAREFVQRSVNRVKLGQRIVIVVMMLFMLLAVLAGVLGLRARTAQHEAERHRTEAESLMGFMLGDFADRLRPLGRLDLLDSVSGKALAYLAAAGERDSLTARVQRAGTLNLIAEVATARGQPDKARQALEAAQVSLAPHAGSTDDPGALETMSVTASDLGKLHLERGEHDSAERHFRQSLALVTLLAKRFDDANHWNQVANLHNSLGAVAMARKEYDKAAGHFEKSVALNRRAAASRPDERKYAGGLANSLQWLGEAMTGSGRHADAARCHAEEGTLLEALHRSAPDELLWRSRLVYALWHQGNARLDEGRRPAALAAYTRARELAADLTTRDPTNQQWQVDLMRLRLRELEAQPATPQVVRVLEDLQRQGTAMSTADPDNPELRELVGQLRDGMAGVRAAVSSR